MIIKRTREVTLAFDLDDVYTETLAMIAYFFEREFGVPIPPHVYHYRDWEECPLSKAEFDAFRHRYYRVHTGQAWGKEVRVIDGAIEGTRELLAWKSASVTKINIEIVTSRGQYPNEVLGPKIFFERFNLSLPIVFAAGQPKGSLIRDRYLAMDDQVTELDSMAGKVAHRLLFQRPHNLSVWKKADEGILPVSDWAHAVKIIKQILS